MKVASIMTPDPVTVRKGTTAHRVMELMDEHGVRHLPVVDGEAVIGVVSDRDVLDATGWLSPRQEELLGVPPTSVAELMHSPVQHCSPGDGLGAALGVLVLGRIGCLPVVDGDVLCGIITETDLLRSYADACRRGEIAPEADPRIESHMTRSPSAVGADASAEEALETMRAVGIRHLPVLVDGELVGILSDRDLRRARGRGQLELALVRDLMSAEPQTARPDQRLSSVALILASERISALPVVSKGELVGLASLIDVTIPCTQALQRLS